VRANYCGSSWEEGDQGRQGASDNAIEKDVAALRKINKALKKALEAALD